MNKNLAASRHGVEFNITTSPGEYEFWNQFNSGEWEPGTLEVFMDYLDEKANALDVGAEVGATAFFMAKISKHVIAIEPSSIAIEMIKDSLALNTGLEKKLTLLHGCLADKVGDFIYGKGSELFNDIHFINQEGGYKVKGYTMDSIARDFGAIDFIKMDIEGGEYIVLPAIKSYLEKNKPTLLVSIHPGFIRGGWSSMFGKLRNIALRYVDNFKLMQCLGGYKYYYDVERKKAISLFELFKFRFIRGQSGNECQILATNKRWSKVN